MKIIDCFTYYNEDDVLELRFKELYDKVDAFVLVESNRTHSNQPKEKNFKSERFTPFADKILYVESLAETCESTERWALENHQRNAINAGLNFLKPNYDHFIMISDVDEIPDLATWKGEEGVFRQRHSYYSFDWVDPRPWNGTVGMYFWRFQSPYGKMIPQDLRNFRDILKPVGLGWHFGWLGDTERAKNKAQNFAHSELSSDDFVNNQLPEKVQKHQHPDGTQLLYDTQYLPSACVDYPQYFIGLT